MERDVGLKEINRVLKYIMDHFNVKGKPFEQVCEAFAKTNPKCYKCSSTMNMFCKSSPDNCSGPHDW